MQALKESQKIKKDTIVNDFSLVVATANGTGSQTANLTILRSFFNMGIPVHGKNIFPSNIQGLPTWYHIRVSKDGYVSRKPSELLIAFNPTTITKDINELPSGGVCIYNSDIKGLPERDDISFYPLPVKELIKDIKMPPK
ncbi:MAG TPA: 2-oxoacid:acceptor oxidoreductase subunit alpha, partial [Trueperaceae bacterium]|nr:2-oxoacid:acceptor oxidoreductase subunit alpha [Trueperaceae bacterium]